MLKKTITLLECSRVFSLPMTIFSWLIAFTYSVMQSGTILYGLVAFLGLCFAHLGTNLIDDYFDYKYLIKQVDFNKEEYLKNSQKTKCRYLINGTLSETHLLASAGTYLLIALLIGVFLYLKCGIGVLYYTLTGGIILLLYPFLSRFCMSEVLVGLAFGPALFGGVYYVMTNSVSLDIFIVSIPSMLMTIVLLYIHTVMDFDFDINEGKHTLSNCFDSQLDSLIVLKIVLILAYFSVTLLCIFDITNWQVFLTFLTIPLASDLYKSMELYSISPENMPEHKWYHFPMERISEFEKRGEAAFMVRMFQARNLMIYFSILLTMGIIISFKF